MALWLARALAWVLEGNLFEVFVVADMGSLLN